MTLLCDLTAVLFELLVTCLDGRLLPVELGCQLLLCRDQFTTSFRVVFDQLLRGFRELVASFDDGLGLISDAIILLALFGHRLLSEVRKSFVRGATASADDSEQQQSQAHCHSSKVNQLLHGHFSIG
jgi:hypothetical protein